MELTSDLLLDAKFSPSRKGYDMAEVDDFLERCAEGLDVLLARLRAEFERAEQAESRIAELEAGGATTATPAAPVEEAAPVAEDFGDEPEPVEQPPAEPAVDEPMRILVHAERTAEAAVSEARADAERIRAEAESIAGQQRSEAEQLLATAKNQAVEEARRAGDAAKQEIQREVLALHRDRDGLSGDVRNLQRWLDDQRVRMRTAAQELERLAEDPTALQTVPVPELSPGPDTTASFSNAPTFDDRPVTGAAPTHDHGFEDGESTQAVPIVDDPGSRDDPDSHDDSDSQDDPWAERGR